jgi:hypothetical protein
VLLDAMPDPAGTARPAAPGLEEHGKRRHRRADGRYLSTEVAGGFTGRVIDLYAAEGTCR